MASTVLYMSVSLDGFVTGPNVSPENGLGDGGERLHEWIFPADHAGDFDAAVQRLGPANRQIWNEMMSTGAVIAGRATFEPAGGWGGDHHDGVPIYILSRNPAPAWAADWPLVHYVNDLEFAVRAAKEAAGDKNVLVHGSGITQRALAAGLLDELELHLVPILLGAGQPLFGHPGPDPRTLERTRVLPGDSGVTHLHYRLNH
ncbi:dihydrofolate reductase family protein [Kribbella deserti]|uniref:Dihydrofolate reductase family protein n=1 Tax=Kribbella deserti TaxID=1926257 RepID=A0ABV6QD66_9ACTN